MKVLTISELAQERIDAWMERKRKFNSQFRWFHKRFGFRPSRACSSGRFEFFGHFDEIPDGLKTRQIKERGGVISYALVPDMKTESGRSHYEAHRALGIPSMHPWDERQVLWGEASLSGGGTFAVNTIGGVQYIINYDDEAKKEFKKLKCKEVVV